MIKLVDIWKCPECDFEMNAVHASNMEDDQEDCPCCNKLQLEAENKRFREALSEISNWDKMLYSPRELGDFAKKALGLLDSP